MNEEIQIKWISGFWKRVGALLIDSIILGIIGLLLGLFLEKLFVGLGLWGRLVGFLIAMAYFGIMNSKLNNGQTIGKKVLKLRVVNINNEPIGLIKSIVRYSILSAPFSLNGIQLPDELLFSSLLYILSFVVFGGMFSIIYLYIFNRTTRQSLHDIAVGSYVVNINTDKQPTGKVWKPHYAIVGLFSLAVIIAPMFTSNLAKQEPFANLLKTRSNLMENPSVVSATVSFGNSSFTTTESETKKTSYVSTQILLKENDISNPILAESLAKSILNSYPDSINKDIIQVNLIYGYDIGIASKWRKHPHRFNPSELSKSEQEQSNNLLNTD